MADIDLRELPANEAVLHFGGALNEVDAYTFSNALISISEAIQEINRQIDPDHSIQIVIEGVGPGSFRAKLKTTTKSIRGLFRPAAGGLLLNIASSFIFEAIHPSSPEQIIVEADAYIIQRGDDRIILPKSVGEARQRLTQPQRVRGHIAKGFQILEEDANVTEFGIAAHMGDSRPIGVVPRSSFGGAYHLFIHEEEESKNTRSVDYPAKLVVVRAIFERSSRRWQFIWNGIKISAPIHDHAFFDKLVSREYRFAQGDTLDVNLRIHQKRDEISGAFFNEAYEITEVRGMLEGPRQGSFLPPPDS